MPPVVGEVGVVVGAVVDAGMGDAVGVAVPVGDGVAVGVGDGAFDGVGEGVTCPEALPDIARCQSSTQRSILTIR